MKHHSAVFEHHGTSLPASVTAADAVVRDLLAEARTVGQAAQARALEAGETLSGDVNAPDLRRQIHTELVHLFLPARDASSPDNRMDALHRANKVRTQRAQLKRDLKDGRVSIHALLLDPPDFLETAKVFDLLLAVPKYGRVKANKLLQTCRISPSKTIGGLSDRQRAELVGMLRR